MRRLLFTAGTVILLTLAGCTSYRSFREAQLAEAAGDWDQAVLKYLDLVHSDPSDLRYRAALMRAKIQASHQHFEQAKRFREAGLLRQAMIELQQAVQLDTTNQYARSELEKVRAEIAAMEAGEGGRQTLEDVKRKSRGVGAQPPVLDPRSPEPIDLDFPDPVSVKQIYQALGKAFGINVLFDPNLRDQTVSIQLKDVSAQDALEILMRTASHFYKVLDEHSIIVVADTPQNRRTYEDLIIQTFFLSNSDVKEVMTMLRSLVDARKIAANEQLNAIILRDTADKVKVAERIIRANDKAKAEVVVDVELLQLNTSKLQDLGVSLDSYQVGVTLDTGGEEVPLRFSDLEFLNSNNWLLTIPNFLFDFVKNSTEAQTLAKPQLRISEGETARLRIGDRVPIPVTSFNTSNTVGSNIVPLTSFQYQDVGILIEIEPRVHHNEEVSLEISVEVSNIAGNVGDQPIIGTRMIETTIRLQDGETNFLAGLIRTDETESEDSIPGFGDIPLLGRLFSKKRTQNQRTDIVLTLTPHIIRRADITQDDLLPIWVGTEANITFRAGSPRIESDTQGPFDGDEIQGEDAADEVRRRLQRLPRGLRPGQGQAEEEEPEPPAGVELVPSAPPRNPLDRRPPAQSRPPPDLSHWVAPELPPRLDPGPGRGSASWTNRLLASSLAIGLSYRPPDGSRVSVIDGPDDLPRGRGPDDEDSDRGPPEGLLVEVSMVPRAQRVGEGETFELAISAASALPLSHLPTRLLYDPLRLEWIGASRGRWLGAAGEAEVLAGEPKPGTLILGASRLGSVPGVSGQGRVIELRFRARKPGAASVRIDRVEALTAELVPHPVELDGEVAAVEIERRLLRPDSEPPGVATRGGSP